MPGKAAGPAAVLLIGVTGSGKTTLARALAARGLACLSVDEEVHRIHGRYGVDYPEAEYLEHQRPVVDDIRGRLAGCLRAGHDVVLDYGLWLRAERAEWSGLVRAAGGRPRLVYLPVKRAELLRRLAEQPARGRQRAHRHRAGAGRLPRPLRAPGSRGGRDRLRR